MSHLRRLYQNELKSNNSTSTNFKGLANKVTVIKQDCENLSKMMKKLPVMMEKEISNARLASERLLSGTSSLDGKFYKNIYNHQISIYITTKYEYSSKMFKQSCWKLRWLLMKPYRGHLQRNTEDVHYIMF